MYEEHAKDESSISPYFQAVGLPTFFIQCLGLLTLFCPLTAPSHRYLNSAKASHGGAGSAAGTLKAAPRTSGAVSAAGSDTRPLKDHSTAGEPAHSGRLQKLVI